MCCKDAYGVYICFSPRANTKHTFRPVLENVIVLFFRVLPSRPLPVVHVDNISQPMMRAWWRIICNMINIKEKDQTTKNDSDAQRSFSSSILP